MFKIGDKVSWTSSHTAKTGRIVKILPQGKDPLRAFDEFREVFPESRFSSYGGGCARKEESYFIALDPKSEREQTMKLYWPINSVIKLIN